MPTIRGASRTEQDPRKPPYPFTEAMNEDETTMASMIARIPSKVRRFIFG